MPMREYRCGNGSCPEYGDTQELLRKMSDDSLPPCRSCGCLMPQVIINAPAVVWARPFSFYDKAGCQNAGMDSHIAYRVHSSRSGNPEPVVIDSFQKQREFCRDEGLRNPTDVNPNAEISADGKKLQTAGVKGQW